MSRLGWRKVRLACDNGGAVAKSKCEPIMSSISANLQAVQLRLAQAADAAGRTSEKVQLLAVSKTFDADAIVQAVDCGQRLFGENYVQEGVDKVVALRTLRPQAALEWHFIGPLQSNKTRLVATHFDWVHTIERLKIAQRLSEQRPETLAPLQVCIQVNISGEASKSGVAVNEAAELARQVAALPRLQLRGLMAIPEPSADLNAQRAPFRALKDLLAQLQQQGLDLDTLSMGMSVDIEAAVTEGATIVRVGTAIFGQRHYEN